MFYAGQPAAAKKYAEDVALLKVHVTLSGNNFLLVFRTIHSRGVPTSETQRHVNALFTQIYISVCAHVDACVSAAPAQFSSGARATNFEVLPEYTIC